MRYQLTVYSIQEQGKRANQEDSLFPALNQQNDYDRLFVLCDGMGGHAKGEVASATVCEAISASVKQMCPDPEGVFTDEMLLQAINDAFDSLDAVDPDDGSLKKMGTTMTFLKLHADGATIAHMGDSRVYHVRPGRTPEETRILFVTEDHSLVNDLVKIGELTPEEARTSKQKNVITRAMQPHMERRPRADIYHTVDIRPGDYFFLCSDGILERWDDYNVRNCFSYSYGDDLTRVQNIIDETRDNSDNHTAIIVKILDVEGAAATPMNNDVYGGQPVYYENTMSAYGQNPDLSQQSPQNQFPQRQQEPLNNSQIDATTQPLQAKPKTSNSILWFWVMLTVIVVLLAVFIFMLVKN